MGLEMRMSQQLIMTPQLQQAIKLLQLSRIELEELIDQSLIENPTLEMTPVEDEDEAAEKRAFHPVEYTPGDEADSEFPFKLVIRDILQHSGSMSTSSKSLDLVVSEALLEINEDDAEKNNITDNTHVKVSSKQGSVFLKASVSEEVPEGTVFVPTHFPHAKINMLTRLSSNGENPINLVKIEKA